MNEDNDQIKQRLQKLEALREKGQAYPNDFRRDAFASKLHQTYACMDTEQLSEQKVYVKVVGRLMSKRIMGKASFAHLEDVSGRIQLFLERDTLPEGVYNSEFKQYDIGDIVAAEGELFHTRTGELTVRVQHVRLLCKSLRPLPEKYHGLTDQELRYRQRYLDLIMSEETRALFKLRSQTTRFLREFMEERDFLEVETPMMHPIPGGALARPFVTHHNVLDMDLYLRIAPELYLKRLVVGGLERVYEINRNFRNEGISTQHNPEFTMMEFYQAYADYHDLMDFTEQMLRELMQSVCGSQRITYQDIELDFSKPFARMTLVESINHYHPEYNTADLENKETAAHIAADLGLEIKDAYGLGKVQTEIFEHLVEEKLIQPTFITAYPVEVSPLSRRNDDNDLVSDRFELFIAGREIANGFSELNDPQDQAERFQAQVVDKEAGDLEAMHFDSDYIRALEYAMPPTAGEGVGIDRLVMLITDSPSIRDVLLFPHMRPQG